MEYLSADLQEQLKKSSTERLRLKLSQAGEDVDVVTLMDRPQLLETLARILSEKKQEEERVAETRVTSEVRLRELALEEKRLKRKLVG